MCYTYAFRRLSITTYRQTLSVLNKKKTIREIISNFTPTILKTYRNCPWNQNIKNTHNQQYTHLYVILLSTLIQPTKHIYMVYSQQHDALRTLNIYICMSYIYYKRSEYITLCIHIFMFNVVYAIRMYAEKSK